MIKNNPKDFYGSNETFVFCLEPEEIKFPCKSENNCHIHSDLEYFSFGTGPLIL